MCDKDHCVLRTSFFTRNFGRRFSGCQHLSLDSDQACKFFRWLDKGPCPRGRATTPIVWERFKRLAAEAEAAKNERDNA
ncbi:hypothetical protein SO802_023415 [Lithocarpus litseifolius]|uniref:Zinc finger GRF-type domain-containing protein n=1 Tax=Lithocarpus litseifolius TaxID=425828 RepID=A0AAW2C851_9ROSI